MFRWEHGVVTSREHCGFRSLALNLVIEQAIRLGGSLALIGLGFGLNGVIAANSAAIAIAYYSARVKLNGSRSQSDSPSPM